MKVAIGMQLRDTPWGGGNQAVSAIARHLEQQGHGVCFDLEQPDLDLVLLTSVRRKAPSASFIDSDVLRYLRHSPGTVVVHRVNECDERREARGMNRRLRRAGLCADAAVFVSSWLRTLHQGAGYPCQESHVILNGSDASVFRPREDSRFDGAGPLRIVTHHWDGGWHKGFDVYQALDRRLSDPAFRQRFAFTYVGQLPEGFRFENARYVEPLAGPVLARELAGHHAYLTASRNEPGSNHQNEGALCGLPLLYVPSGSMAEYAEGFGIAFEPPTWEPALERMRVDYATWRKRIEAYPHRADRMVAEYEDLLIDLLERGPELRGRRPRLRELRWHLGRPGTPPRMR